MQNERKNLLVKVFGKDRPGITKEFISIFSENDSHVLDLGQSVTHDLLSLSFLISCKNNEATEKDILLTAKKLDINIDYQYVEAHTKKIKESKHKFIISSVHPDYLSTPFLSELTDLCAKADLNICLIKNKSQENKLTHLELGLEANKDFNYQNLKKEVMNLSHNFKTDLAIIKDDVFRFNKRLIIFDMDSTLIQCEVIEEMAKIANSYELVKEITQAAMEGKYDFEQSLIERVKTLEGLSIQQLNELIPQIKLTEGIEDFIKTVKSLGFKTGIISGGFSHFANHFKTKLGLDYAFSNVLEFNQEGRLTGKVTGEIVDAKRKATLLEMITQTEGISLSQTVAIGDGANDLYMLSKAGMGIAFHAKKIVKESADQHMSHGPMTSILTFLGIPQNYKA